MFGIDQGGGITAKIVDGRKRTDLLCTTLIGTPRMMRPYIDEIISRFEMESMSFEEMVEAADADAMEQLAMAYLNGNDESVMWAEQAAAQGNADGYWLWHTATAEV